MSEQKYYVRLKKELWNDPDCPTQLGQVTDENSKYANEIFMASFNEEDGAQLFNKNYFTKSELTEVMEGALYTPEIMSGEIHMDGEVYESGYYPEWINPLIELVPVEMEE